MTAADWLLAALTVAAWLLLCWVVFGGVRR